MAQSKPIRGSSGEEGSRKEMLLAKRKVGGGRGEAVTSSSSSIGHFAFGPQEDEAIIKHRLLTRTTTTRGEPPLKKLQKKFTSLFLEIQKDADNNLADCERHSRAFIQELTTFELPLRKSRAVIDANLREKDNSTHLKSHINSQILLAQNEIEILKIQLQQAKIERQHKEECESIRSLIAKQPPRSLTQNLITDLQNHIAALEAHNTAASRTLDLRKKQFALLLHVVDELQNTIEEEQKSLAEEMRMAAEENKSGHDDVSVPSVSMVID
ncbi:hypothetical protein QQ045_009348 [Rhodiola kirilowii]